MDLTFAELAAQLPDGTIYNGQDDEGNLGLTISLTLLNGSETADIDGVGVVKLINKLFGAAYKAQLAHNQSAAPEDVLNSFSPTSGSVIDENGYLVQSQTFTSKLYTASATDVTGYQTPPVIQN